MKREYNTGTKDSVTFFIGTEIEHTPAYGMRTLFVVGAVSYTHLTLPTKRIV